MKRRQDFLQYNDALSAYLAKDDIALERAMNSLNRIEKALILIRVLIRKQDLQEAELMLRKLGDVGCDFFKAEVHFLSASLAYYRGTSETAMLENIKALELYEKIADRLGQFRVCYNLSVDFATKAMKQISSHYLQRAQGFADASKDKVLVLRALACEAIENARNDEALQTIEKALALKNSLVGHDLAGLLVVASEIIFRVGQMDRALEMLQSIPPSQIGREKSRWKFEIELLKAIKSGGKLGPLVESVQENSGYNLKWKIINAIQSGERQGVEILWNELSTVRPHIYGHFPEILDAHEAKSSFGVLLRQLTETKTENVVIEGDGLPANLIKILQNSAMPLRKNELIEMIWQVPYSPHFDHRFYKLLERTKRTFDVAIVNENRAYRLTGKK